MVGRRKYHDGCAVAHGLDLIGERWALLVVRELLLGPKRFTDLRAGIPGASPDMLSQRLRELQDAGIVGHRRLAPPAGSWIYELTEWGQQLEPIVTQLGRWASRSPAMPHDAPIGVASVLLSLKALFEPRLAGALRAAVGLRFGEDDACARVADGRLEITHGPAADLDVRLDTDPATLAAVLGDAGRFTAAVRAGEVTLYGDASIAKRFVTLFPAPEPAPVDGPKPAGPRTRS